MKGSKQAVFVAAAEEVVHKSMLPLTGQIPIDSVDDLGHPIHPATVHWPIAVCILFPYYY